MMKRLFIALAAFVGFSLAAAHAESSNPVDLVSDTSRQVLDLLKKDDGKNSRQVRAQVEALVVPKFDFKRMTALAVGRGWRDATPDQQAELSSQFQSLLTRTYASTMWRFKQAQIDVKPNAMLTPDGREATVRSEVLLPNSADKKPVSVDYILYRTPQGWRVYNVIVEGASLVTVYRNQFNEEIRKNGIDGLIKVLRTKNDSVPPVARAG